MLTALFVVTGLWSSQDKFDFSRDFSRFLEGLCRFLEYFRDFPGLCRWWVTLWEASRRVLLRCPVKMEICLEGNIFKKELGWNSWYEGHDMIPHEMVTKMYLWRDRQQEGNNEDIFDTGDRRSTASGFHKFGRRCEPDRDNYEEENIKHALKDTTETFSYHYHQITTNITMTMITTPTATSITMIKISPPPSPPPWGASRTRRAPGFAEQTLTPDCPEIGRKLYISVPSYRILIFVITLVIPGGQGACPWWSWGWRGPSSWRRPPGAGSRPRGGRWSRRPPPSTWSSACSARPRSPCSAGQSLPSSPGNQSNW